MGVVATGGDSGGAPSLCTQCVCMRANGQDSLLKQIQNMGFRRGGAIAAAGGGEGGQGEERRGKVSRSPSSVSSFFPSRSIFSRLIRPENRRAFAKEAAAAWPGRLGNELLLTKLTGRGR